MDYPEEARGQCTSCGFLARSALPAPNVATPDLFEISYQDRHDGNVFTHFVARVHQGNIETEPICLQGVIDIPWLVPRQHPAREELATALFREDRKCPKWFPYQPGRTPQQHFEDFRLLELETQRREWEQRLERERKDFDLKLFEMGQRLQEGSERFSRRATWVLGALATAEVIGTTVAVIIALTD